MDKAAERKADYEWLKAHRVCVECRRETAVAGSVKCAECKEKSRKRWHAGYQRRRALGLCAYCSQPAAEGHTMCQHHMDYYRNYTRPHKE